MRRCPECPTEYLVELKMMEDKSVKVNGIARFKQALVVTRWSDLGPGRSPVDDEWAAITGEKGGQLLVDAGVLPDVVQNVHWLWQTTPAPYGPLFLWIGQSISAITGENKGYDSFQEIGRRAVSGVFESAFTDTTPGQRIVTMNPMKVKANDIGGDWY